MTNRPTLLFACLALFGMTATAFPQRLLGLGIRENAFEKETGFFVGAPILCFSEYVAIIADVAIAESSKVEGSLRLAGYRPLTDELRSEVLEGGGGFLVKSTKNNAVYYSILESERTYQKQYELYVPNPFKVNKVAQTISGLRGVTNMRLHIHTMWGDIQDADQSLVLATNWVLDNGEPPSTAYFRQQMLGLLRKVFSKFGHSVQIEVTQEGNDDNLPQCRVDISGFSKFLIRDGVEKERIALKMTLSPAWRTPDKTHLLLTLSGEHAPGTSPNPGRNKFTDCDYEENRKAVDRLCAEVRQVLEISKLKKTR